MLKTLSELTSNNIAVSSTLINKEETFYLVINCKFTNDMSWMMIPPIVLGPGKISDLEKEINDENFITKAKEMFLEQPIIKSGTKNIKRDDDLPESQHEEKPNPKDSKGEGKASSNNESKKKSVQKDELSNEPEPNNSAPKKRVLNPSKKSIAKKEPESTEETPTENNSDEVQSAIDFAEKAQKQKAAEAEQSNNEQDSSDNDGIGINDQEDW